MPEHDFIRLTIIADADEESSLRTFQWALDRLKSEEITEAPIYNYDNHNYVLVSGLYPRETKDYFTNKSWINRRGKPEDIEQHVFDAQQLRITRAWNAITLKEWTEIEELEDLTSFITKDNQGNSQIFVIEGEAPLEYITRLGLNKGRIEI